MKRKRNRIGIVLLGLFLAYFSASFLFVPKAPGLKEHDTHIVKLETHDSNVAHGTFRSSTEHSEDVLKSFDYYNLPFLASFHTAVDHNRLLFLENSAFPTVNIYLSLRRLQI